MMKNNDYLVRFSTCEKIGNGNGQDNMNISSDINQTMNTGLCGLGIYPIYNKIKYFKPWLYNEGYESQGIQQLNKDFKAIK